VKILATFDESLFSEAIIPQLEELARLPDVEIVLLSLVETPLVASDAVDAALAELSRYLDGIVQRLPKGPRYRTITAVTMFPAASIIEHALDEQPDVIVMATHGRTGLARALFGSVTDQVVRAWIAPVLLVRPSQALG
jgi:nucleotide-binding universal stress UspA family protein